MFRIIRIAAFVGTIAFFSPVHDRERGVVAGMQTAGSAGLDALTRFLTASWRGSGNVAALLDSKSLQDSAAKAILRRTLDPAATSSLAPVSPPPRPHGQTAPIP